MRAPSAAAWLVAAVAATAAGAPAGAEPVARDSLAAEVPELEQRFAALETAFAAARASTCSAPGGGDVRCLEAETLAEVAEELLQEGEAAVAVELLEEAVALLGAPGE